MKTHFRFLLAAMFLLCVLALFSGAYQRGAKWSQPNLITLQSTINVLESSEPIGSISVAEDGLTLQVVSSSTSEIETYRNAPDGSLLSLGKVSGSTIKSPSGASVQVDKENIAVLDAAGKIAGQFTIPLPAISTVFLRNGDLAVAAPSNTNLIQVYNPNGKLLSSFGAVRVRDLNNESQNNFLNRGKILVDPDGFVYYVYTYVPLIQKYTPAGKLLYEVEVKGEAIDIQQNVASRFFNIKKPQQVGGIDIITGASIERQTGHLWIAMNGSSTSGVVYEYNQRGQKLHEYALQPNSQIDALPQNITGVKDLAVTSSWIYIVTYQQQVYSFKRNQSEQAHINPSRGETQPANFAHTRLAFAPSSLPKSVAAFQTTCPTNQPWNACSFTCPNPGTCTGNPPQPPANTSDGSMLDCKATLMSTLSPGYSVVSSMCTQNAAGTAMHTHGGCKNDVTICTGGTQTSHSVTLDCPAQSCNTGGGGGGGGGGGCSSIYGCGQAGADYCTETEGGFWDDNTCCCHSSPILLDVAGNGFNLTDVTNGVDFDLDNHGLAEHLSWTAANSDDAWLALDRNGNGVIDSGSELFGNTTPQPIPSVGEKKNGFLALAEFDKAANGGNGDGMINSSDAIFTSLRLWQDLNHNGISESNELHTLSELGIAILDLDYKTSKRTDQFGNRFRYRAKVKDVHGAQVGRWAWDVFLVITH